MLPLKRGITRNITWSTWWMPYENQTSHEAQFFTETLSEIQQFDHLIKIYGKIILEPKGFRFYVVWLAENSWEKSWSGLHGDAIWKACSMQSHLESSKLAILCLFPKHSHLFAFPKWSCFNILQQPRAICLAMCPFCWVGNYQDSLCQEVIKTLHIPCFLSYLQTPMV